MLNRAKKFEIRICSVIFLWILLWNLVTQMFLEPLHSIGFASWSFFLITILFFLVENENQKRKYAEVFIGSLTGLILAGALLAGYQVLADAGLGYVPAVMIPLAGCLAMILILHPIWPLVFNNCSFAYFLVALSVPDFTPQTIPACAVSMLAGHVLVNIGTLSIILLAERKSASPSK